IKYNYLNLPEEIIFDATHKIIYLYNALGNRLKKKIVSGQNSMVTDYVSNMVYLDDTLQMVMTEEGRMLALDSGGFQAEYFLKDHLGNNRLTISDADEDGDAEIVQEDHFYPYGMTMSGLSYRGSTVNNYLFQGKEQQSNFNLWWYDFGARMFDEQLGRWHVPDPKLQFSSPYVGMGNNPASNIDPDGRRSFGAERYPDFFSLWAAQKACSDKQMEWNSYVASWSATGTNKNRETAVIYLLIGSDGIGDESEGFGNSMIVSDEFTKNYIRKQIDGGTIAQVYAIVDALMNDNELFNLWAAGGNPKIYIIPISDDRVKEDGGMETIFPITAAAETNRLVGSRKVLDEENNLVRWNSKIDLYPKAFTDNLLSVTLGHEFYHAKHNFDGSISNWSYNESPIKGDLTYGIIKSEIAAYQYNINKTDVQDPYYQQWKELQNYYQLYLQLYPQRPIYTP
ncbi:MAG: hypothetical protein JXB17_08210, partial [Bacteroidales bacterium]|nr:hypothetical protein [Bacteroidales bacterium]